MKKTLSIILGVGAIFLLCIYIMTTRVYQVIFEIEEDTVLVTEVKSGNKIVKPFDDLAFSSEEIVWYTDKELTVEFNFETKVYRKLKLYGKTNATKQEFAVIFLDINDFQIGETQFIKRGSSAIAPEAPVVEGYKFLGWDKPFNKVTMDLSIKAVYDINEYEVTFVDFDDSILSKQSVPYKGSAIAPDVPTREGYEFIGWCHSFDEVTSNLILFAQYQVKEYIVKFVDHNDELIEEEQIIPYGGTAIAPDYPVLDGYTFVKWDQSFVDVKSDLTIKAIYRANTFIVTFVDYDESILSIQTVDYNGFAIAPKSPTREGYIFIGWSHDFDKVTNNLIIFAKYKIKEFVVSFIDYNDELIDEKQIIPYGGVAIAPEAPLYTGHTFSKWDQNFSNVKSNLVVKAI